MTNQSALFGSTQIARFDWLTEILKQSCAPGEVTPQPPKSTGDEEEDEEDEEGGFESALVDNMLGFASTPRGLVMLYRDGMLDQCVGYLYRRKCKKLQVRRATFP